MANETDTKLKALEDALKSIEKTYGKGAVMRLGERPHVDCDVIPTGSILLDQALGVGGYPLLWVVAAALLAVQLVAGGRALAALERRKG